MSAPQWMSMADPIHGMIRLKRHHPNHQLILDVMNSKAFQRLRRIRQMGMAEFVFPGATHSRFVHSIGSAWLMIKAIEHFQEYRETRQLLSSSFEDTNISLETLLLVSILVHDIGHTPLSHTLEDILDLKKQGMLHDTYWNRLILEQDEELQRIWKRFGAELPYAVARFNAWENEGKHHFLADLVSSQLDMDRLDYLLRDSHYLGVQYGRIEIERIITNMVIGTTSEGEQAIAIREEAMPAVEHYLFGRYQAYKMALHSLDKASETLLKKTLERFHWVRDQGIDPGHPADLLYQLMTDGHQLSVEDYLMLDDCYLWDKISLWARYSQDTLLQQLANRLLGHDLFKYIELLQYGDGITDEALEPVYSEMQQYYNQRGLSFEFGFEQMVVAPKALYQSYPVKPPIWIRRRNDKLIDFANATTLPLNQDVERGRRRLLFVWDNEAKSFLKQVLDKYFDPQFMKQYTL